MQERPCGDDAALFTIDDLALKLRVVSTESVRAMIRRGECPPCDFRVGTRPRWIAKRFAEWLEARAVEHEAAVEAALDSGDPRGADAAPSRLERAADLRGKASGPEDRRAS
jgi:hypothetical protein